MTSEQFFGQLPPERKEAMQALHEVVVQSDPAVEQNFSSTDAHSTITYTQSGEFKYALASRKDRMSLHIMPMYIHPDIRDRYEQLLTKAKFMKGCINFKRMEQLPPDIVAGLIRDSAAAPFPVKAQKE